MVLKIPGRLPGLNEIIDAAKSHFGEYASMKETYTNMVGWLAKKLPTYEKVALIITWYEPDRRRDPDNIMAGQKFILDGMVQAGTIPNDSQKHIKGILHRFDVDKKNPRIEVEIADVEKDMKVLEGQELWD
jgi:Holliday junction resolvase RusA-like endonuclease